jgi:hypothetical protein
VPSTVKLRPVRTERLSLTPDVDPKTLAQDLVHANERPIAWCVLDWASEATAGLVQLLVSSWGSGLCYQPGVPWADDKRPAVLPKPAGSRILRASRTRVWLSDNQALDRDRVMESLEHGCLPLQFTPAARVERERGRSELARALRLRPDESGTLAPLSGDELKSRVETVASALSTGALERALSLENG